MRAGFVALLALGLAGPVQARDFYYFHKAKVSQEAFQGDRLECRRLMGGARAAPHANVYAAPNTLTPAQNAAAAGIAAFFEGMMRAAERRRTMNAVERTCMADKGYDRYRAPEDVAEEIENLPNSEDRLVRYFAMAAAAEPVGERMVE